MTPNFLRISAAVLLAASSPGHAAPITWNSPVAVRTGPGNSADVSTDGTLVEAYNAAVTSYTGGNRTVNGVTFVATTNLLPLNSTSVIDFSIATNGGDANYDAILSTADYGGGGSTNITIGDGDGNSSVTGPGLLEIGKQYLIQVWFVDDRAATNARVMGYGDSSSSLIAQVNDQYVIGTFTADATTQTLFLDTVSSAAGDSFANAHITAYQLRALAPPADPTAVLSGSGSTSATSHTIFLSFSENVAGLEAGDFVVVNGSVSEVRPAGRGRSQADNSYEPSRRHYSARINADSPGSVQMTLPAGSVKSLDGNRPNLASNTFSFVCAGDFNGPWIVDERAEWADATGSSSNLVLSGGFAEPTAATSLFSSIVRTYPAKRKASSLTLTQSPVWDNWQPLGYSIQNAVGSDAPVFVPAGPGDYYVLALGSGNVYHAWHSTNMVNWTPKGPVTSGPQGRWVTSAEYKDGFFYIYSDFANDHTSHVFRANDLGDGVPGTYLGPVLARDGSGSDLAAFRDNADGRFHLIYEDWSPINARNHSWDSPLAGHTSSVDGINGFYANEHRAPVDLRTNPTGTFSSYTHPFVPFDPTYEVHTPAQEAFGDWTAIKVGGQYYLFGDYDPVGRSIRAARFTSDSIYGEFKLVGEIDTGGHPDPTVGFAEGQFYLITQFKDFKSPGPWVDGVEARVGVDENGDGISDTWTAWQTVGEQYDYTPNFIRVVTVTPAGLDLSGLPPGYGFQFEFRVDDTVVAGVSPIMDRVEMSFVSTNFEEWSKTKGVPAEVNGDHNQNDIPNLAEFALGGAMLPFRQPDGTLMLKATHEALEDGYTVELRFSQDLKTWTTATPETAGIKLLNTTTLGNGDQEMEFDIPSGNERMFWNIAVF